MLDFFTALFVALLILWAGIAILYASVHIAYAIKLFIEKVRQLLHQ